MAETHKQQQQQQTDGQKDTAEPYIVSGDFDAVSSYLELDAQQVLDSALQAFSPALGSVPTGYVVGGQSPAWSLSSSSNGDSASGARSPHVDGLLFPSVDVDMGQYPSVDMGQYPSVDVGQYPSVDMGLDGWLQQFVNAEALGAELALAPDVLGVLAGLQQGVAPSIAPQKLSVAAENAGSSGQRREAAVARRASGGRPHMVPLAPRQAGGATPPGLGVLARTAQSQAPIGVKNEPRQRPIAAAPADATQRPIAPAGSKQRAIVSAGSKQRAIVSADSKQKQQQRAIVPTDPKLQHSPNGPKQEKPPQQTPPADSTAQKRQERLIKNRAAALLSRKRKREYLTKLESEVEDLREANVSMAQRMAEMERRLSMLTQERDQLRNAAGSAQPAASTSAASGSDKKQEARKRAGSEAKPDGDSAAAAAAAAESDAGVSAQQPQQSQQQPNKRQRTAGALLMAMLFSFSLFTLPPLYTSDSQIAVGGVQSAGVLPSPEPRLLLPAAGHAEAESPLVERVRRSISAFTQQQPMAQQQHLQQQQPQQQQQQQQHNQHNQQQQSAEDDEPRARVANSSTDAHVRPMTMEESVDLHTWIRRGLKTGARESVQHAEQRAAGEHTSSLAIVSSRQSPAEQLDYAMLYCPSMKHVLFSGDAQEVAEMQHAQQQQSGARVLDAPSRMDDVDDAAPGVFVSPKVERTASHDVSLLMPTSDVVAQLRPKLSLYSPVVTDSASERANIRPPWEEYARQAADARQKYLRIDVEVVGSKWVTADKFANGLY